MTRILAIGAHPDDCEIGCGGLLQTGSERRILVLTHGEAGGPYATRTVEQEAAAEVLGATLDWGYNADDTRLDLGVAVHAIEAQIRVYQPDMVLTMGGRDTHQDHVTAHRATMIAVRNYPRTVLAYVGPSSAVTFHPTWFAGVNETQLVVKVRAVACHASQAARSYTGREYIEGMGRYWAMVTRAKAAFVEPFEVVRAWMA